MSWRTGLSFILICPGLLPQKTTECARSVDSHLRGPEQAGHHSLSLFFPLSSFRQAKCFEQIPASRSHERADAGGKPKGPWRVSNDLVNTFAVGPYCVVHPAEDRPCLFARRVSVIVVYAWTKPTPCLLVIDTLTIEQRQGKNRGVINVISTSRSLHSSLLEHEQHLLPMMQYAATSRRFFRHQPPMPMHSMLSPLP